MAQNAIEIHDLGKEYRRRELGKGRYKTLRESLTSEWWKRKPKNEDDFFWALRHINLEIPQGEIVGVIGPNGAGKSTLLKLLTRVTAPTEGHFTLRGRVASLLEVGTGFHPELTGRENIYLSGTIMGMKRVEINKKFDEIVAFSGVEKFLDLPVKRYSSGMFVRLGFAVAAHLEAEILLVDEVLAVGDAEFQKKCLGKMGDVAQSGRTVLFVSHNLGAVRELCEQSVLIMEGEMRNFNNTDKVIDKYLRKDINQSVGLRYPERMKGVKDVIIKGVYINEKCPLNNLIQITGFKPINIKIHFELEEDRPIQGNIAILKNGIKLFTLQDIMTPTKLKTNALISEFILPSFLLRPGIYTLGVGGKTDGLRGDWFWTRNYCSFEIIEEYSQKSNYFNFGLINVLNSKNQRL